MEHSSLQIFEQPLLDPLHINTKNQIDNDITNIIKMEPHDQLDEQLDIPDLVRIESLDSNIIETNSSTLVKNRNKLNGMEEISSEEIIYEIEAKGVTQSNKNTTKISMEQIQNIEFIESCLDKELQCYKCPLCPYFTKRKTRGDLRTHLLVHADIDANRFHCTVCSFTTKYKHNLRSHYEVVHSDSNKTKKSTKYSTTDNKLCKLMRCNLCDFESKHRLELRMHITRSHPHINKAKGYSKSRKYAKISRTLLDSDRFVEHCFNSGTKNYKCPACLYFTKTEVEFKIHLLNHAAPNEKSDLQCNLCSFTTKNLFSIRKHIRVLHPNMHTVRIYKCLHCPYRSKDQRSLNNHKLLHEDRFICNICSYKTKYKSHFSKHMTIHQKLKKRNQVENEEDSVADSNNAISEYEDIEEQDQYEIKDTDKRNRAIRDHLITLESGKVVNKCPFCPYYTKRRSISDLKAHMVVHEDPNIANRFRCAICPYGSKHIRNLRRHGKVHLDIPKEQQRSYFVKSSENSVNVTEDNVVDSNNAIAEYVDTESKENVLKNEFDENSTEFDPLESESNIPQEENQYEIKDADKRSIESRKLDYLITLPSGKVTYQCPLCPYYTKRKNISDLKAHMLIHKYANVVYRFRCAICPYRSKHKKSMTIHAKIHCNIPEEKQRYYVIKSSEEVFEPKVRIYKCIHCPFRTKHRFLMPKHRLLHNDADANLVNRFVCQISPSRTKYKQRLPTHQRTEKSMKEEVINMDIQKKNDTSSENAIKDDRNKNCEKILIKIEADENSTEVDNFLETKTIPQDEEQYKITYADSFGVETTTTYNLDNCITSVSGKVVFKCPLCSYYTARKNKGDLKTHMLVHQDPNLANKYCCDICPYRAKYHASIKKHIVTVHKNVRRDRQRYYIFTPSENSKETNTPDLTNSQNGPSEKEPKPKTYNVLEPEELLSKSDITNLSTSIQAYIESDELIDSCRISETHQYKCPVCFFVTQSRIKGNFKRHLQYHITSHGVVKDNDTNLGDASKSNVDSMTIIKNECDQDVSNVEFLENEQTYSDIDLIDEKTTSDHDYSLTKSANHSCDSQKSNAEQPEYLYINDCRGGHEKIQNDEQPDFDRYLTTISDITVYQCPHCPFHTKRKMKSDLRTHMMIHQDPDKVNKFSCTVCSFRSKHKWSLRNHMTTHTKKVLRKILPKENGSDESSMDKNNEDPLGDLSVDSSLSHGIFGKTSIADLTEQHLTSDESHDLTENFIEEELSPETAKRIGSAIDDLNQYVIIKAGKSVFQCPYCTSQTDGKKGWDFKNHLLSHEIDPKEIRKYYDIVEENLSTKNSSDDMLTTNSVDEFEQYLTTISDRSVYKCPMCEFYTKRKSRTDLKTHMLIHQNPDEVNKYRCKLCTYRTKYKNSIKKHIMSLHMLK